MPNAEYRQPSNRRASRAFVDADMALLRSSEPQAANVSRADAVIDTSPQEGNLVRVKNPQMLTLVGLPANQTGFKIVRNDGNDGAPAAPATTTKGASMSNVIRRTRRSAEVNPILRLAFPAGSTQETVEASLKTYGMTGYTVAEVDGVFTATRGDVKSISQDTTMDIKLNEDGLVATVARSDAGASVGEKSQLTMASLEFDSSKFTLEEVQRWATEKSVDGAIQEPQNAGECYVVRRSEVPENEETRRMELEDGVTAIIIRSDVVNIPVGYVAVVNEAAYGGWGWGQLDFAAAMADSTFSEAMRSAISMLEDVLRNIVVYSALPLDVRKDLANRALAQFGEYIGIVLDSLPRQLLVSVVRSATPQQESPMSKEGSGAATNQAAPQATVNETPLTRADVQTMITEAVATALRAAPAAAAAPAASNEPAPAAPAATPAAEAQPITRADMVAAMAEALKPLADKVTELAGTTAVRSAPEALPTPTGETSKDVFRGALPGIRRRAAE